MSVGCSHFNQLARERGSGENGKHRTEVTEVTEGDWIGPRIFWRERRGPGCENHAKTQSIAQRSRRSQRGEWIGRRTFGWEHCGLGVRVTRKRKASHRGHGGHRGGLDGRRTFGWEHCGLDARVTLKHKASHRGHGGHRGGIGLVGGFSDGNTAAWMRGSRERQETPEGEKARMPHLYRSIDSTTFGVSGISNFNGIRSSVV
jgi:hypothetical protein